MQEIADILKISKSNDENHLHQLGCVNSFDVWGPHKLSEKNRPDHISPCDSLLKCNKNILFLKQILKNGEKWIPIFCHMYHAHFFAQMFEEKLRMHIVHWYNDYIPSI